MTDYVARLTMLADQVQARADGDAELLALARGLRQAAGADRPATAIAHALQLPTSRPRIARAQAFDRMATSPRYADLKGKPLYEKMLSDLQRYAASTWRTDRRRTSNPYAEHDWRAHTWLALSLGAAVPTHWKTLKRARARGQVSLSTDPAHGRAHDADRHHPEAAEEQRDDPRTIGRLPAAAGRD